MYAYVVLTAWVFALGTPAPEEKPTTPAVLQDRRAIPGKYVDLRFLLEQAVLLKSKPVLEAALRRPDVAELKVVKDQPEPLRWLRRNLQVDIDDEAGTLSVRLLGGRASEQVALINAVVAAFLEESPKPVQRPLEQQMEELGKGRADAVAVMDRVHRELPNATSASVKRGLENTLKSAEDALRSIDRRIERLRDEMKAAVRITLVEKARAPQ